MKIKESALSAAENFIIYTPPVQNGLRLINSMKNSILNKDTEKCRETKIEKSGLCIVLDKGLGDFLLFAPYLDCILEWYRKNRQNTSLYILGTTKSLKFLLLCNTEGVTKINTDSENIDGIAFDTAVLPLLSCSRSTIGIMDRIITEKVFIERNVPGSLRGYTLRQLGDISKMIPACPGDIEFYGYMHRALAKALTGEDFGCMLQTLPKRPRLIEKEYYLISLSASTIRHEWPPAYTARLIEMLKNETELIPVLLGKADEEDAKEYEKLGADCSFLGKEDLDLSISLIQHARLVIAPNTGTFHLSAAAGTETIVLENGERFKMFTPYPKDFGNGKLHHMWSKTECRKCPERHSCQIMAGKDGKYGRCMLEIKPEEVFSKVIDIISG